MGAYSQKLNMSQLKMYVQQYHEIIQLTCLLLDYAAMFKGYLGNQ